jgi:coproporphyrinogen III oxidase
MDKKAISDRFKELQDHICKALEAIDGLSHFEEDLWDRAEGGGGRTRTISDGRIIEKGGVAFSAVFGPVTEAMSKQLGLEGKEFYATGVSIVLHPKNPHVPIIHMNVRYFQLDKGVYWFGGGIDLTPHYVIESQAGDFHRSLKQLCDQFNPQFYSEFKNWADNYFFIPHREETRGVGGIFFDHLDERCGLQKEEIFNFCYNLGELFPIVYGHQVKLGKDLAITDDHIKWRNLRRGRYVEFNLVHDKGTKFGLFSGGRTESILMSLPPDASWVYCYSPAVGSREEFTLSQLKKGQDWISC